MNLKALLMALAALLAVTFPTVARADNYGPFHTSFYASEYPDSSSQAGVLVSTGGVITPNCPLSPVCIADETMLMSLSVVSTNPSHGSAALRLSLCDGAIYRHYWARYYGYVSNGRSYIGQDQFVATSACVGEPPVPVTYNLTVLPDFATANYSSSAICAGDSFTVTLANAAAGTYGLLGPGNVALTSAAVVSSGGTVQLQSVPITAALFPGGVLPAEADFFVTRNTRKGFDGEGYSAKRVALAPVLPASVSVAATATTIIPGTSVTFSAAPANGGATPTWRWQINEQDLAGETAATLTRSNLLNNDRVRVLMTSAAACASGSPATSNVVTMIVASLPDAPVLTSAAPGNGQATLTFNAPASNGSAISLYTGSCVPGPVAASNSSSPLTVTGLPNGTIHACTVSATNGVGVGAASAAVSVIPSASTQADLSITKTNNRSFVTGGVPTTYLIEVQNPGPAGVAGVRVVDALDAAFSLASWNCTGLNGGACNGANGSGSIDRFVDLPPGAGVRFNLTATPAALPEAPVSNLASITVPAPIVDANLANNVVSDGPDLVGVLRDGFE